MIKLSPSERLLVESGVNHYKLVGPGLSPQFPAAEEEGPAPVYQIKLPMPREQQE